MDDRRRHPQLPMNDPGGGRRSEWGKNLYDLRPLYAERMQLRRVGPVPEPAEPKGFTEYLFDERRRLVETRSHRGAGRVDVERYRHGDDGIDVEHIAATPGVPVTHSRYELAGGHVVAWRWQTLAGLAEETYTYEGERVTDIRTSYVRLKGIDSVSPRRRRCWRRPRPGSPATWPRPRP
jgi:hypothetical protein